MAEPLPTRAPLSVSVTGEDPLARGAIAARLAASGEPLRVTESDLASLTARTPSPGEVDVVVLDLGLGSREVQEPLRELTARGLATVALVSHDDAAAEAASSGASAVLFRDASPSALAAAVRAVDEGLAAYDRALVQALLRPPEPEAPDSPGEALTPREGEVLRLLAEGLSNKHIAARLSISEHTAKFHVNAILSKLHVQRRTEAVVRAARLGMVTL